MTASEFLAEYEALCLRAGWHLTGGALRGVLVLPLPRDHSSAHFGGIWPTPADAATLPEHLAELRRIAHYAELVETL